MKKLLIALCIVSVLGITGIVYATPFQAGSDRLVETQNNDGGWDWPLNDGNPDTGSALNTIGPIGMGLAQAYLQTGDPAQYAALENVSELLRSKTAFSTADGYLAGILDDILGGTANVEYVNDNFYNKLATGTYERNGTLYDTEGYVNYIRSVRANQGIANLAAWDIGMGLAGAAAVGADTSAWIAGTKNEIDELNGDDYYDVLGLAGSIYGLASVGEDFDPTAGTHADAASLLDLTGILAGYQIDGGGFSWNSNYITGGNEAVQETAYAILALNEVDRAAFLNEIQGAAAYLKDTQLETGGWENRSGSGENNEITGEALWGLSTAEPVPEPSTMFLLGAGLFGLGVWRKRSAR